MAIDRLHFSNIYHPVQPRFKEAGDDVQYTERAPHPILANYICCYWQLKTNAPLQTPFLYTAVTDGCIDFFFDLNSPHENYVMGFSSQHTQFSLNNEFNYAGVRFFPGAFPGIYHIKASELTNQCYQIPEVLPRVGNEISRLLENLDNIGSLKAVFDNYFIAVVRKNDINIEERFLGSLKAIIEAKGSFKVESNDSIYVSPRQLRRQFDFYVGASPKEFNKIIRFQQFLKANITRRRLRKEKPYYDFGYYDQSHFIKDFKLLYGTAPLQAL